MVLENGQTAFGGSLATAIIRNGPAGLQSYAPPVFSGGTGNESILLPNRVGASGQAWKLAAIADTIQTAAGSFVALHFISAPGLGYEIENHLWVVPGTGVVRWLIGLATESESGITIRQYRFILELESIVRP
jgi:hypothetical protein